MDEFYMLEAIKEAELAFQRGDYPIGAIIVLGEAIVSRDGNRINSGNSLLSHAELNTLNNLSKGFIKENKGRLSLYTTYEPCPMCFGAIVQSYIKKLVYGINLDKSGATSLKDNLPEFYNLSKRGDVEIISGVLEDKCREVFMKSDYAKELVKKGRINNL